MEQSKILECDKVVIRDISDIKEKLDIWFIKNKEKKVRFITQTYIPVDRTPLDKEGKYEETRSFHLYTIFYEKP